jgi:uncharacterized membrane protein
MKVARRQQFFRLIREFFKDFEHLYFFLMWCDDDNDDEKKWKSIELSLCVRICAEFVNDNSWW